MDLCPLCRCDCDAEPAVRAASGSGSLSEPRVCGGVMLSLREKRERSVSVDLDAPLTPSPRAQRGGGRAGKGPLLTDSILHSAHSRVEKFPCRPRPCVYGDPARPRARRERGRGRVSRAPHHAVRADRTGVLGARSASALGSAHGLASAECARRADFVVYSSAKMNGHVHTQRLDLTRHGPRAPPSRRARTLLATSHSCSESSHWICCRQGRGRGSGCRCSCDVYQRL